MPINFGTSFDTGNSQGFLASPTDDFWGGLLGKLSSGIQDNLPALSIVADQVGTRLNPNNPFAGVGTALAKSKLAGNAEKQRGDRASQMTDLIRSLTKSGVPGGNKISFAVGKDGMLETVISHSSDLSSPAQAEPTETDPEKLLESLQQQAIGG